MRWTDTTKEIIQYATAVGMLAAGVVLSAAALYKSGWRVIPDSVLWYAAQTLVYAGSIFGVSMVIRHKFGEIKNEIKKELGGGAKQE